VGEPRFRGLRLLVGVSRPEFLPANLSALTVGISWAINPPFLLTWNFLVLLALCFLTITLVSAFGAQLNTMFDYDIDRKDKYKKDLVRAMEGLGRRKLKAFVVLEFLLSAVTLYLMWLIEGKLTLLLLWVVGTFLVFAYSTPPIRLKTRSWMQMVAIFLVLSIVPMLFIFYTFASLPSLLFLIFLAGEASTIYAVIIPTEIRDYFGDSAMRVKTMTVRLGLRKASFFSIILLTFGGLVCGATLFVGLYFGTYPWLSVFLIVMAVADVYVLSRYRKLYGLSKKYRTSKKSSVAREITDLAAHIPRWIMLVTQALVFVSLVFLIGKFL